VLEKQLSRHTTYRALLSTEYGATRHTAAEWRLFGLIHNLITIDPLETVVHIGRIDNWKMSLDKHSDAGCTELKDMSGWIDA